MAMQWQRQPWLTAMAIAAILVSVWAVPAHAQRTAPATQGVDRTSLVELQILAINDFHGHLATTGAWQGQPVGRADFLAAHLRQAQRSARHTIVVSAGDLIGASPLISALFHDEPTIEAMNLIGLEIHAVGNHEFDEGPAELLRMQRGGRHPVDGDLDGDGFAGAQFVFLAANVVVEATGQTLFPPYTVRTYDGVQVAFIGMTLKATPTIVTQAGVAGLTFLDEAQTVNRLVPELQQRDIEAIVVLLHEGGAADGGPNDCGTGLSGPIAALVPQLDDAVDLVITGHTNDAFVCKIGGTWVTMADHAGRLYTDIDVTLNRVTRELTVTSIRNVPTFHAAMPPAADLRALIDKYDALSAPLANAPIGTITLEVSRTPNAAGESALGDVIADAQLWATASSETGGAVVALTNAGGIRADLPFASSRAGEGDGVVTFGEAFTVQPFGNSLVTMTLRGAQLYALLEQQWDNPGPGQSRILQVSGGFSYAWDSDAATGAKVVPGSVAIGGVPIEMGTDYRVTVNSFLAAGGDQFTVLRDGAKRLGGPLDLDALVAYVKTFSPVAPGRQQRITRVP